MKKLIGVVSAVFLVLFLTGPAFANELSLEDIVEQEMQTAPEGEISAEEEAFAPEIPTPTTMEDAEIPQGEESPFSILSSGDNQAPAIVTSHIDTVKVDLSVDVDGQTYMPVADELD